VTLAVENRQRDLLGATALALTDLADDLADRFVESEEVLELGCRGHLLHVHAGTGIKHRAALGQGDHGECATETTGSQGRSLERVDGDVDDGRAAVTDVLTVVEHRRLVLFALADDDDAVHRHGVEQQPHGVHRGAVGGELVTTSDPPGSGQCSRFSDPDQLECEVAVRLASGSYIVGNDAHGGKAIGTGIGLRRD